MATLFAAAATQIPMRLAALVLVALATSASAWPESAAPELRSDVVGVGHAPDVVFDGQQFEGFLVLAPESNVTHVYYQVCLISDIACIIPPREATLVDGVWRFDTADFADPGTGNPPHWKAGARIGVQWFLGTQEGLEHADAFPKGTPLDDPACGPGLEKAVACYETHYFEFPIEANQESPMPLAMLIAGLVLLAARRR